MRRAYLWLAAAFVIGNAACNTNNATAMGGLEPDPTGVQLTYTTNTGVVYTSHQAMTLTAYPDSTPTYLFAGVAFSPTGEGVGIRGRLTEAMLASGGSLPLEISGEAPGVALVKTTAPLQGTLAISFTKSTVSGQVTTNDPAAGSLSGIPLISCMVPMASAPGSFTDDPTFSTPFCQAFLDSLSPLSTEPPGGDRWESWSLMRMAGKRHRRTGTSRR